MYSVGMDGAKPLPRTDNLTESVTVDMNMDMLSEKYVVFNQAFI